MFALLPRLPTTSLLPHRLPDNELTEAGKKDLRDARDALNTSGGELTLFCKHPNQPTNQPFPGPAARQALPVA